MILNYKEKIYDRYYLLVLKSIYISCHMYYTSIAISYWRNVWLFNASIQGGPQKCFHFFKVS